MPTQVTLNEGATQQFTSSLASTWTTDCGTVSTTGLFKAQLYPKTCKITATATDGSGSVFASATAVSPITMTPVSAKTPQGLTQQFTSSAPVIWTAKCGTITAGGLFTASAPVGTNCTIQGTAASGTAYTVYGYDSILAPTTFSLTPLNPILTEGSTQQFTSNVAASWVASCGNIDANAGLYTAPLTSGSCAITATATDGSGHIAATTATITSPLVITPASATTAQGQAQQFAANMPVIWTASCGSISASGLFTASVSSGSICKIGATAASGTAYTASALDTVGTAPALTISPTQVTLNEGATQQFTSNVVATWIASCGSIDANSALYTAPLAAGSCTVTATATDGSGHTLATTATITSPLVITPASATTAQGQTQQFTANLPVNWTTSCGSIDGSGLFTASVSSANICTIGATAASGTAYTASALAMVGSAPALTISPVSPTISQGTTQQFTSNVAASWVASCGNIDANAGLYTAPLTSGSCAITVTATDGSGHTALTSATITSPISITPGTAGSVHAIGTQQFTASTPVTWSTSCGNIDANSGLFTAPASAATCIVTATATGTTAYTAQSPVDVDVVNYVSWKGGRNNLGVQSHETLLTTSNVNASQFGVKWTGNLDGYVFGQPLYMNGLSINGVPHNVVFVATSNDSIYAFDGDTGALLWQRSFLTAGVTAVIGTMVDSTTPQIGILSTPVIDPDSGTLYAVAETAEKNATYFPHRLHAIDVTNGLEKFNGPVLVSDVNLAPVHKMQRAALVVANGMVYIGFGSLGDRNPYHGFLFAFDEQTLVQKYVWNTTSTGGQGGIWMAGGAPAVDQAGNLYLTTGNGTFDGSVNFGEAAIKLSPSLQVLDYFAPYNYSSLNFTDSDLGSSSIGILPDQDGQFTHELIVCGKTPSIYVLNRDNMGQLGTGADNVIQRLDNVVGTTDTSFQDANQSCFATPAFWNSNMYIVGNHDVLKTFTLNSATGLLSSGAVSQGSFTYAWPGAQPVVSANGTSNGIVWTLDLSTGQLLANDASNVATQLYAAPVAGLLNRFTVPTVVNGHVYVGGRFRLVAYTLQ